MKITRNSIVISCLTLALAACSSNDDDATDIVDPVDPPVTTGSPASFQITVTNMTTGQLMTPPVAAIHDASVHLFEVGATASDAIRNIAETGADAELVAFATDPANAALVSGAGVIGDGPFAAGGQVTTTLATENDAYVFSLVNMVICTNDAIAGVDSVALPATNEPLTLMAMAYDAGTRVNQSDNNSFFPPPCRSTDVVEAPVEDPRQAIAAHAGQTGITVPDTAPDGSNWDFAAGVPVMQIEIVRN